MEKKQSYREIAERWAASLPDTPLTDEQIRALINVRESFSPDPLPSRSGEDGAPAD